MTQAEAQRTVEILRPHFPVAEVRKGKTMSGFHFYYVRTYGKPSADLDTPETVGAFIADKIRGEYGTIPDDIDDRETLDAQDQMQAAKEERERTGSDNADEN